MAAKASWIGSKIVPAIFAGIVAPVIVEVTVKAIHHQEARSGTRHSPSQEAEAPGANLQLPPPSIWPHASSPGSAQLSVTAGESMQIIVKGTGKSAQAALHDAFRNALSQAMAAQVSDQAWSRHGPVLLDDALRHSIDLVRGWRQLESMRQRKLGGTMYTVQIAMELDRRKLRQRLSILQHIP